MNHKLLAFFSFCLISYTVSAQSAKDSIAKVIANEMCAEFDKKDFSKIKKEDIEMELGMLMLPSITDHQAAIEEAFGISSITENGAMEKVGLEIGKNLVVVCPSFAKFFSGMADAKAYKTSTTELKGTVVKVVPGDFTHVLIKGSNGKTEKIWIMEYFSGSETLLEKPLVTGKKVTISYKQQEVYNATLNQYLSIKIATSLTEE